MDWMRRAMIVIWLPFYVLWIAFKNLILLIGMAGWLSAVDRKKFIESIHKLRGQ